MIGDKFFKLPLLRKLGRDERGSILVQFTITIVAIMGLTGLALDVGRALNLNSDLQKLADAAALAGANQLNGFSDALTRADTAARAVANDVHWWDVSAANILAGTAGVQFYATLADVDANNPTTDPKKARLVQITTGAWQTAPTFVRAVGANINKPAQARALARGGSSNAGFCKPQTMLLCNPSEPPSGGTGDTSSFNPTRGTMFVFSTNGNTGGYSPGVFNLLDNPAGDGSDVAIKKFLSQQNLPACTTGGGASPAQGQKTNATIDGINVRFDQQPNGTTTGMDVTPAQIKIDGLSHTNPANGNRNCNQLYDVSVAGPSVTPSLPLPLDPQPWTSVGGSGGSQIGNGVSLPDLQAYWDNHHPHVVLPPGTTRYDVYLMEDPVNGTTEGKQWTPTSEQQGPQCASTNSESIPSRRVLQVAVVDCVYWGVQGNAVNNIPLSKYSDFFLILPTPTANRVPAGVANAGAGGVTKGQIYVEFLATHNINENANNSTGGCGVLCPITQLVR